MKIHPVGAELLHVEGRTDMTKLTVAYCNFVNAPKDGILVRVEVTGPASQLPFVRIRKNVGRQKLCTQKAAGGFRVKMAMLPVRRMLRI